MSRAAVFLSATDPGPTTVAIGSSVYVCATPEPSSAVLTDPAGLETALSIDPVAPDRWFVGATAREVGTYVITVETAGERAVTTFDVVPPDHPLLLFVGQGATAVDLIVAGPPHSTVRLAVYTLSQTPPSQFVTELPPAVLDGDGTASYRVARPPSETMCVSPPGGSCLLIQPVSP